MLGIIFCLCFLILGFCIPDMTPNSRNWYFLVAALFYIGSGFWKCFWTGKK